MLRRMLVFNRLFMYAFVSFVTYFNVFSIKEKYISLPILNFYDVVMSCGNEKFSLILFVKSGALQF
jgi:hypothetical protein